MSVERMRHIEQSVRVECDRGACGRGTGRPHVVTFRRSVMMPEGWPGAWQVSPSTQRAKTNAVTTFLLGNRVLSSPASAGPDRDGVRVTVKASCPQCHRPGQWRMERLEPILTEVFEQGLGFAPLDWLNQRYASAI